MRILFADTLPSEYLDQLCDSGHFCESRPGLAAAELAVAATGFDVLVVRSKLVSAEVIESADELELIVRAGAGTNNIDVQAAADRGIAVCNVPGKNAIAVAELTMGLMLCVDRHIADGVQALREGRWDKKAFSKSRGLFGRQLGLLGVGEIGLRVGERAKAFGMNVVAVRKPGRSHETERRIRSIGIRLVGDLDELLASSDVVSLHMPSSAENKSLVDSDFLSKMKHGATLVNTSRGDLLDEAAVLSALNAGAVNLALDTWPNEPTDPKCDFVSSLACHPRVIGSHHIGASTEQAQEAVAAGVIEVIDSYVAGDVKNCVNMAARTQASATIVVRHLDRVGVLAAVLGVVRSNGLNVGAMRNQVFVGSNAAVATLDLFGDLSDETIASICEVEHVVGVSAEKWGET